MKLLEYNLVKFERTLGFQICNIHQTLVEYLYKSKEFKFNNINLRVQTIRKNDPGCIFIDDEDDMVFIMLPYLDEDKNYDLDVLLRIFDCSIFETNKIRDEVFDKVHECFKCLSEDFKINHLNDKMFTTKTIIEI